MCRVDAAVVRQQTRVERSDEPVWRYFVAHATPVESAFSLIAMASLCVSIYALRDANVDSQILSAAKVNGPRRAIADNNIHQEQLRFGISIVMVLASNSFL